MTNKRRSPAKGTKSRLALLMMMRPQGATINELKEATKWTNSSINAYMSAMLDNYGLDIRSFPLSNRDRIHDNRYVTYRLVGKIIARGKYRSFV